MRALMLGLVCVLAALPCRAQPLCPVEPLKIAFPDRAAGAFLRGTGAEFDADDPGLVVREVKSALKAIGCTADLIRLPHKRVLAQMDAGTVDFVVGFADLPERLRLWRFPLGPQGGADKSMAIGESPIQWVVLAARRVELQARWREGSPGSQLGALQDSVSALIAEAQGFKTRQVLNLNEAPKLLMLGRFDAIAMPTIFYAETLSSSPEPLATLEPPLGKMQYYAPASRALFERAPALVQAFWNALCQEARRRHVSPGCRP